MTTFTITIPTWFCQAAIFLLVVNIIVMIAHDQLNQRIADLREKHNDLLMDIFKHVSTVVKPKEDKPHE